MARVAHGRQLTPNGRAAKPLETAAYAIAGGEETAAAPSANAPAGPEPIAPLLASADASAGKEKAKLCITCHSFDKGGPNKIGPNLYAVVGDEIAHGRGGFAFSEVLKGKGGTWTADNLNHWLWKPQSFAKGTKMTFIGLPKAQDRANVIAYLNSLSDSPKPLQNLAQEAASAEGQGQGQGQTQPSGNAAAAQPGGAAPAPAPKGNAPAKP